MRFVRIFVLAGLMFSLANCSIDVAIDDVTPNDFLRSTILATSRGVGDGQTSAQVILLLKNSDDSLVVGYKPSFDFVDNGGSSIEENGVTFFECTVSNDEGISTCVIKSIVVGAKRLLFNNITIDLVGEVFFDPPDRGGTFLRVVSSGQIDQNAGGYSVTSHVGSPFSGLKQEVNGYTVFTNTTGGITPVE